MADFLRTVKKYRANLIVICITCLLLVISYFSFRNIIIGRHIGEYSREFSDEMETLYRLGDKSDFFNRTLPDYLDKMTFNGKKANAVCFYRVRSDLDRGTVSYSNNDFCTQGTVIQTFLRNIDAYVYFNDMLSKEYGKCGPFKIDGQRYYILYCSPSDWDISVLKFVPVKDASGITSVFDLFFGIFILIFALFIFLYTRISLKRESAVSDELELTVQTMKDKDARLDLLSYLMNEFTFEYDIAHDTLAMSDKYKQIFQRGKNFIRFRETIKSHYTVYHLDVDNIIGAFDEIMAGKEEGNVLFRLQMVGGNYEWFNALYKVMYSADHKPSYVVGKMVNVHKAQTEKEMLLTKSTRDPLTNLLNRSEIEKRTTNYISEMDSEDLGALLIMDLDHFKQVNDTFGHSKGDDLLRDVSVLIRDSFRTNDIVGRLGGDEFYVFMKDIANENDAVNKCDKLRVSLQRDVSYGESTVSISSSMGIVFVKAGMQFLDIYMKADSALYRAKETGRNRICVYNDNIPAPKKDK